MRFKVGDEASERRVLTEEIVRAYGTISGDMNPIHYDDDYAVENGFKGRIAHGLFCLGMISNLIGNRLPGPGAIFLDEVLRYQSPVYMGDEVEATVKIDSIKENGVVIVSFCCRNQEGTELLSGTTKVLMKAIKMTCSKNE